MFGIDFAWHPKYSAAALKKKGVTFVCRYLSHDITKDLSKAEADALRQAGLEVVVVWETSAERAKAGHRAGSEDAAQALLKNKACGLYGNPIYFAVDFEANGDTVNSYFQGVKYVLGTRTGVYGSYRVCKDLLNKKTVYHAWQTYAWSSGLKDPRAEIYQYSNGHNILGIDCDYDTKPSPPKVLAKVTHPVASIKVAIAQKATPTGPPQLIPTAKVIQEESWFKQFIKLMRELFGSF